MRMITLYIPKTIIKSSIRIIRINIYINIFAHFKQKAKYITATLIS